MFRKQFGRLIEDARGGTAIEYGLIAALLVVLLIGAIASMGAETGNHFNNVQAGFDS